MDSPAGPTLTETLDGLALRATRRDIPPGIVAEARRATLRRLGLPTNTRLSSTTQKRAEAYFSAIVRRRAVRKGQPARVAARFVVAAVVEDLRQSGRDGTAVWEALERGWTDSVPPEVMEEYRLALCG